MSKRTRLGAVAIVGATTFLYWGWLRPWQMRWGATDEEVALRAPGDEFVPRANFMATRAVSVKASPEEVWPWLVQIGHGRAGWYSYDVLDNKGQSSAWEIIPEYQHMQVGDVVPMSIQNGRPFGPSALSLDPHRSMLWGDPMEPTALPGCGCSVTTAKIGRG